MSLRNYGCETMGADVIDIARAKIMQRGLERLFDAEPTMKIYNDKIRLFWEGENLRIAQDKMVSPKKEDAVKIELGPVLRPYLIKKYGLTVLGLIALGYVLK